MFGRAVVVFNSPMPMAIFHALSLIIQAVWACHDVSVVQDILLFLAVAEADQGLFCVLAPAEKPHDNVVASWEIAPSRPWRRAYPPFVMAAYAAFVIWTCGHVSSCFAPGANGRPHTQTTLDSQTRSGRRWEATRCDRRNSSVGWM